MERLDFAFAAAIIALVCFTQLQAENEVDESSKKHVLVFGGNGFLGALSVVKLLEHGYTVHTVNRGNWYWDSDERIKPHVHHVYCDREGKLEEHCPDVMELFKSVEKFEAVIDFSAFGGHEVNESIKALEGLTDMYILLSTDAIYDVAKDKTEGEHISEDEMVRPDEEHEIEEKRFYFLKAHNRREAEEGLEAGSIPYVILRLPDVLGPRDTTNRFWLYQLWLRLAKEMDEHKVVVPDFLHDYPMSFVYSEDVADMIVRLLDYPPEVKDNAYNLAWPMSFTLHDFLETIQGSLGLGRGGFNTHKAVDGPAFWMYPTIRRGPLNVTKAEEKLNWQPTRWEEAIRDTVHFYENAFKDDTFENPRNEIIQVVENILYQDKKEHDRIPYYEVLEKIYGVELHHFKRPNDEL